MDEEEIRALVRLMDETGLAELELERDGTRLRLVRGPAVARGVAAPPEGRSPVAIAPSEPVAASTAAAAPVDGIPPGMRAIESPMVGTFHAAPQPDDRPFVLPGDVVRAGQVLCIVEAMKMMNEVCAEFAARVVSVRAENGSPVEYGSILFVVEPLA